MTLPTVKHPLVDGLPEPWAVEWGEDRYGVFMGFAIDEVVQRMRWVPSGRFVMGSPESEIGRIAREGPQHEVELSSGFWLAETPCTQSLWQAVMETNPSNYVSADRPVERVSWDDCKGFVERLNALVRGLEVRLPTEAEWEYACRGGTTAATWVGELDIRGENNAPRLDAIAWYGGNSGHDFDLTKGHDSRGWPETHYPQMRVGTRTVRQKLANPVGLHDMLGNVYEWCEDWFGPYDAAPARDPSGPKSGSERVFRGGSWYGYARSVRAANRNAYAPGTALDYLGFRLARSQEPSLGPEPSAAFERSRRL
jgi:formylglycine-generating enzyme required for sulfatase activity